MSNFKVVFTLAVCLSFLSGNPLYGKITLDTIPVDFGKFDFLEGHANEIIEAGKLDSFYKKLEALEREELHELSIVHIGDSHVQADFWTGELRRLFQDKFGDRGRGLVFPFVLANSHNPKDIHSTSNVTWEYKRNIFKDGPGMGIAGASIATDNHEFFIDVVLGDSLRPIKFNKITLFNKKGPQAFDFTLGKGDVKKADLKKQPTKRRYHRVRSGETLSHLARRYGCSVSSLKRWNGLRSSRINIGQRLVVSRPIYVKPKTPDFTRFAYLANTEYPDSVFSATLHLDKPANQLVIKGERQSERQKEMVFHGVSFENTTNPGILYHAVGVNGASFYHYNKSAHFFDQLDYLKADLIIVSLGTNESLSSGFDVRVFSNQVDEFLTNIAIVHPGVPVLLVTNPEALKNNQVNPNTEKAAGVIRQKAQDFDCALWDLKLIMGDSMGPWKKAGLARPDGIHFTEEGYELQGKLLYNALINQYGSGH